MVRSSLLAFGAIALAGCGAAYQVDPAQISAVRSGTEPNKSVIVAQAEARMRSGLKDPESAKFEWPNGFIAGAHQPLGAMPIYGWITCGTVNARNSYGGYVGAQALLLVVQNGQIVFSDMDNGGRDVDNAAYCRLYGVPVR